MKKIKSEFWVNKTYNNPDGEGTLSVDVKLIIDYPANTFAIKNYKGNSFNFNMCNSPAKWIAIFNAMKDAAREGKQELDEYNKTNNLNNK